jgi:serine/threonine-protein kinase ATR
VVGGLKQHVWMLRLAKPVILKSWHVMTAMVCGREFSVRRDFATLSRMLPLSVMVPTSASFTLSLPATTSLDLSHNPFGNIISIAGIKDEVDVLSSLQKPKKVCTGDDNLA